MEERRLALIENEKQPEEHLTPAATCADHSPYGLYGE